MTHIIKVHLEHKQDIIRDIEIESSNNLEQLHHAIINAFELDKDELASFYITNEKFELIKEIPLYIFDEKESNMLSMNDVLISSILPNKGSQLLYVYDFLKMWRFLIIFYQESNNKLTEAKCINSIGDLPKVAPEFIFNIENEFDPYDITFDENHEY